jgi:myo-inositol-1(or 4)-monophosphatase
MSMPRLSAYAVAAVRAALAAGAIQRRLLGHLTKVEFKGPRDPVTEADRASEDAIVDILREAFPEHAFVGEEGGAQGTSAFTWLIDPLDGTHNYTRGLPWFAVSIALRYRGQTLVAAVYNPVLGEGYAAESGRGAYVRSLRGDEDPREWADLSGWRRLTVSTTARLEDATLGTGFPQTVAETGVNLDHFANLIRASARLRALGSAALSLAAVAAGQMDGYWEIGPKAWDFAAGALLVEEAGGRVTDLRGRPLDLDAGRLLATNGVVHDSVLAVLARGQSGLD